MNNNPKLIRITTVPTSLNCLLKGQMKYMSNHGLDEKAHTINLIGL